MSLAESTGRVLAGCPWQSPLPRTCLAFAAISCPFPREPGLLPIALALELLLGRVPVYSELVLSRGLDPRQLPAYYQMVVQGGQKNKC